MEMHDARSHSPGQVSQESPRRVLFISPTTGDMPWAGLDGTIAVTPMASCDGIDARLLRGFDALVVDWTELDDNGRTRLENLRRAHSPTAVIALVPPHFPEITRAARRAGATMCLLKTPDYRIQLPQAVETAIEQARLRGENRRLNRALQAAKRRKEHLQRQLRVILDRLAEGVLILDAGEGRIVAANAAAEQLWGVPLRGTGRLDGRDELRAEAADGTPIPTEASAPLRALRRDEAIYDESVVLQPDARRIPVTVDAVPFHAPDGSLAGVVSLVHDRSAPVQLASLREALETIASHQMKNPLTVILGYSTLLLKSPALAADNRARQAVARIRRESLRLRHLADNLIEFSRLEMGRGAVQAVSFDLADLVQAVATRQREAVSPRPIHLQLAPATISYVGDYGRLAQVLDSLIERRAVADTDRAAKLGVALGRHTVAELAAAGATSARPPGEAYATIAIGGERIADMPELRRAAWQPFTASEQPGDVNELDLLVSAALVRKHGGMLYTSVGTGGGDYLLVLPLT
jgi:signal transduction histidine kinase